MKNAYEPGKFHPSLQADDLIWYRCHPAFGVQLFIPEKDVNDYLDDLSVDNAWNCLSEEDQDQKADRYCIDLLTWFADAFKPRFYFAGAYEKNESAAIEAIGLSQVYSGDWQPNFSKVLTEVNVHELALVSAEHQIVVYESWDNIMTTLSANDLPIRFSRGME